MELFPLHQFLHLTGIFAVLQAHPSTVSSAQNRSRATSAWLFEIKKNSSISRIFIVTLVNDPRSHWLLVQKNITNIFKKCPLISDVRARRSKIRSVLLMPVLPKSTVATMIKNVKTLERKIYNFRKKSVRWTPKCQYNGRKTFRVCSAFSSNCESCTRTCL